MIVSTLASALVLGCGLAVADYMGYLSPGIDQVLENGNRVSEPIYMDNASFVNFYGEGCGDGESVVSINHDGSVDCRTFGALTGIDSFNADEFSTYQDLNTSGRLDNENDTDIVLREQGDLRYWQSLSVDSSQVDDSVSLEDGGSVTIDDDYEPDTTIENTDNQTLNQVLDEGNKTDKGVDMQNNTLRNVSLKAVTVPVGEDAWK